MIIMDLVGVLLVIMICRFDSYPPPVIQWAKISEDGEEIVIDEGNPQTIEIVKRQISPTIHETQLKVIVFINSY